MSEFNSMTIVAAAEVLSAYSTNADMEILAVQWEIAGRCVTTSKSARVASMAKIAIEEAPNCMTESGHVTLGRALVEMAIKAPPFSKETAAWKKLVAGLRFDGFEIVETEIKTAPQYEWSSPEVEIIVNLMRMLPEDIPGLDFREAKSEVEGLLDRGGFTVANGHLKQALSAFQRGEWTSANGELRKFYESYLNEIADKLGYQGGDDSKAKRDFLGSLQPPFLMAEYNEWNANNQKPQYVQGLMSRMHPHGGHPGLSEEEDATFRLQVILVTARLFLRRYNQRKNP